MKDDFLKFEKILTTNDDSFENISHMTFLLFHCMKETNEKHNVRTEYFRLKLTDSEKNPFAKDLILEWATISYANTKKTKET
jgi:hypothetical protein